MGEPCDRGALSNQRAHLFFDDRTQDKTDKIMIRQLNLGIVLTVLCANASLPGAVIPVTDTNLLNGLTLNNWVTQVGSVNSTVNGASFTLGFNGTQQVALQVDNGHLSSFVASRCRCRHRVAQAFEWKLGCHQIGLDASCP